MAISFVAASAQVAANSSPQTVTLPSGWQKGDLLLIVVIQASASGITFSSSGYSSLARNSNATRSMTIEVLWKIATASESNPSVTCSSAAGGWAVQMVAYRGVNRSTPEDAADVSSDSAAAQTWQPTGITTVTDNAWVVSFVGSKDDNALNYNNQNGFSDRMSGANYDATAGNGSDYSVGWADKAIASHGAATMPTWNQSTNGNDAWVGLSLALLPANDQAPIPSTLSQTITTYAPTVLAPRVVIPSTKALSTSLFAPTILTPRVVIPSTKALTIADYVPTVLTPRVCTPSTLALSLSTFAPTISTPRVVTPTTLALSTSLFAPSVLTPRTAIPDVAALIISTFAPLILTPVICTPETKDLAVSSFAPNILTPIVRTPDPKALSLAGFAPDILIGGGGGGDVTVVPSTASLSISFFQPTIYAGGSKPRTSVPPGVGVAALYSMAKRAEEAEEENEIIKIISDFEE